MKKMLFVLLFFATNVSAQNKLQYLIDSMKTALSNCNNDTIKVGILLNLTERYWSVNPPEGLIYVHKALTIIQKMNWKEKMADAYGELGMNHTILSNNDSAVYYLQKCVQLGEEINDPKQIAKASGALGNVYYFQSKLPQAIEYYLKSVTAAEKSKDTNTKAACLSNIGSIYLDLNDLEKGLPYFEQALILNRATKMKNYEAVNLANIGVIHSKKGEPKIALSYFLKALAVNKEIHELPGIARLMNSIGDTYYEMGFTDSAYYYATQGLQLTKQVESLHDVGFSYYTLANILFGVSEKNNTEFINQHFSGNKNACLTQAKKYADSSVNIYVSINYTESLADAYLLLSNIYDKLGNCAFALENYKKYVTAHDSVFNQDNAKKLTQKTMQYDFDKKEAVTKAEQEKKDIRQRNIRYSISAGLLGALIFLGVVYRQRNKIKKEKQRSEALLLNILPEEVAEELKAKGEAEAKQIDHVTVLFTDFKGFTELSEKLSPKELVSEINTCFKAFDHIMHKHGVEKIKTIGDAYMAAGGLPIPNKTHAEDVVNAAIEIQQFMHQHKEEREKEGKLFFEIRIGIHTGPVVAGIVGVKKFAYDIWGDTVNTASRMESSGEAGKINISETTYALVKNKFSCTHRGKISAKGKGEIDMYFVNCLRELL